MQADYLQFYQLPGCFFFHLFCMLMQMWITFENRMFWKAMACSGVVKDRNDSVYCGFVRFFFKCLGITWWRNTVVYESSAHFVVRGWVAHSRLAVERFHPYLSCIPVVFKDIYKNLATRNYGIIRRVSCLCGEFLLLELQCIGKGSCALINKQQKWNIYM